MSNFNEISYKSVNGRTNIYGRIWLPEGKPKATVQIAHGIAEHCGRYDGFCGFLRDNGFAVYINDHLGHGKSIYDETELGFFDYKDGWMKTVEDMHTLFVMSVHDFPDVPHVIFGHSMGSFLTRTYLAEHSNDFDGAVICGTSHMPRTLVKSGKALASALAAVSPKKRSKFLENMAFGSYNKCFEPTRTSYDWLTRDEAVIDRYIEDPLCGFISTTRLFADLMTGLDFITDSKNIDKINKDIPVFFISGSMDPVGENGKGVQRAYAYFRAAGIKDVSLKLYPDDRHEILNELDKDEVYADILSWINEKVLIGG